MEHLTCLDHSNYHFPDTGGDHILTTVGYADIIDKADQNQIQVFEIISAHIEDYPVLVNLFGSRATGCTRNSSDYDIGIELMQDLPVGLVSRLREALEDSHIPYVGEVVDLSRADEAFAQKVRNEGVLCTDTSKAGRIKSPLETDDKAVLVASFKESRDSMPPLSEL